MRAESGCIVIASRTPIALKYRLEIEARDAASITLAPGAVRTHRLPGPTSIVFGLSNTPQRHALEPDRVYVLAPNEARDDVELRQIDFGAGKFDATPAAERLRPTDPQLASGILTIRVVIDSREPETIAFAEKRLKPRLAAASELLEAATGVRLHILSIGTWDPGEAAEDWETARRNLEARAPLESARLVVGFTRQYPVTPAEVAKSKVSEEPLTTHLLVPDTHANFSEQQCLDTLLHEFGHFWGATHVPETSSPMRATLDAPSGPWPLAYDPASALVMSLVADEVRSRGVAQWEELSPARLKLIESLRTRVASARAPASVAAPTPSPNSAPRQVTVRVSETVVPDVPGGVAIWSGVTRDRAGRLWFAVSTENEENASASVFEFDGARTPQPRGNVAAAMSKVAGAAKDETSKLILSSICEGDDGHLYFASIADSAARPDPRRAPRWGSRLWRIRRPDNSWEMLLHVPEGIAAVACHGDYVYALGYPGQRLVQYHVVSGQTKSVAVESPPTHVCRTLVIDARGHLFVPFLTNNKSPPDATPSAELVEFSPQLRMTQRTPLEHYSTAAHVVERPLASLDSPTNDGASATQQAGAPNEFISFDPGIIATYRDATSTKFLTSSGALYSIQLPAPRPQAGGVPNPSTTKTAPMGQRPSSIPRPGQPPPSSTRPPARSGARPPAPIPQAALIEFIDAMNERPQLMSAAFHEEGMEFAVAASPLDSPSRIDVALVPVPRFQRVWSTFPNSEPLKGLTFHGSAAATEGGRYWFAGAYERGPIKLDDSVLQLLSQRGLSKEQQQRLRENSQRSQQPLLFSLEFDSEFDAKQ